MLKPAILPDAPAPAYDAACRRCPRLAAFRDEVQRQFPDYWCRPVPPFGVGDAQLVIVGLAPGMHGANATGRPFTGDYAGILLYETLHDFGYATSPVSRTAADVIELVDCRITNAVKCLPPENKPLPAEVANCNAYLAADLAALPPQAAVLALGRIAHDATLAALGLRRSHYRFAHAAMHPLPGGAALFDSYHCSRYNTNTGRLTRAMFRDVFAAIARRAGRAVPADAAGGATS
jgi:uracil-DNA glycosylase family 4